MYCNYYDTSATYFDSILLRDKCPNGELFLVRIFLYLVQELLLVLPEKMQKKKKHVYCNYYDTSTTYFDSMLLGDKCPNAELFLVRIFLYLVQIQENTDQK